MTVAYADAPIGGTVAPGFEVVWNAFAGNFTHRQELGAACCVYHRGHKVVDLWGGLRNADAPWEEDTMVVVYSATKGLAAMALALAHSRGWLDYDERVCTYWPEFAQRGKHDITVRQLLAHQAGLFALDVPITRRLARDLDGLAIVLARQEPAWPPGTRQGYHAITLGFYEGELLRRIDPRCRSLGAFFQEEIATPLGAEAYIRLPESIGDDRLAPMVRPGFMDMLNGLGPRFMVAAMNPRSRISRALRGSQLPHDRAHVYARNLEVPSGGGVATARGIAGAYAAFISADGRLGVRQQTLDLLAAPAVAPEYGFQDVCLHGAVAFSLGFMKPTATWPFGSPASYGSPGAGGSLGFADPVAGVAYAYVTNKMGTTLTGDPRDVALRQALYSALPA